MKPLDQLLQRATRALARDRFQDARNQLQVVLTTTGAPRKAYQHHPALAAAYNALAQSHLGLGAPGEALRLLQVARRRFPSNVAIIALVARAYMELGKDQNAILMARRALRLNRTSEASLVLAEIRCRQQKYEEAILLCNEALQVEVSRYRAYEILAEAFERLGMAKEALEVQKLGLPHVPRSRMRTALLRMVTLARQARQWRLAEKTLLKLLRFREGRDGIRLMLAELFLEQGQVKEAIRQARASLRLNPKSIAAWNLLAACHLQDGSMNSAISAAASAVEAAPLEPMERFRLGAMYHQVGDLSRAIEQYDRLASLHPESGFADAAHEAIGAIEQYQLQQILIRTTEDLLFRVKLLRDTEKTLSDYGYAPSFGLVMMIRAALSDLPDEIQGNPRVIRYQ